MAMVCHGDPKASLLGGLCEDGQTNVKCCIKKGWGD